MEIITGDVFEVELPFNLGFTYLKSRVDRIENFFGKGQHRDYIYFFPIEILRNSRWDSTDFSVFVSPNHLFAVIRCGQLPKFRGEGKWIKIANVPLAEYESRPIYTRECTMYHLFIDCEEKGEWYYSELHSMHLYDPYNNILPYNKIRHLYFGLSGSRMALLNNLSFMWMKKLGLKAQEYIPDIDLPTTLYHAWYANVCQSPLYSEINRDLWNNIILE